MSNEALNTVQALVESARLLGTTQARKGFGCYTEQDSRFERAMHESISKHSKALISQMKQESAAAQGEPVAKVLSWTNGSYSRNYKMEWLRDVPEGALLYAAIPQAVSGLSDEQIHALWVLNGGSLNGNNYIAFARAILSAASTQGGTSNNQGGGNGKQ